MADKGKVRAAIEEKLKGKSLTKNFKDSIAEKWAAKIATDEEIDDFIEDHLEILLEASIEGDRRASSAITKHKAEQSSKDDKGGEANPADNKSADEDADTPKWAKKLMADNAALAQKVADFENKNKAASIESKFKADERLKGIPAQFFKGRIPQTEDEFESAVEELVNDFKPIAEAVQLAGFGKDAPPARGNDPAPGAGKVDPAVENYAKKQNEKFQKQS